VAPGFLQILDFVAITIADQYTDHSQVGNSLFEKRQFLRPQFRAAAAEAGNVATGLGERFDEAVPDGIGSRRKNTIGTVAVDAAAAMAMVSKGATKTSGRSANNSAVSGAKRATVAMGESPIQDEVSLFDPPQFTQPRSKQVGIRVWPFRDAEERDTANDVLSLRDGEPGAKPCGSRRSEQQPTICHLRTSTML
jgi:hypothetical protein